MWFFDNDPRNFVGGAHVARVACIQVPTPRACVDPPTRHDLPGLRHLSGLVPTSYWDKRAGLRRHHEREFTAARARREGVREVLFDWDGTLTCTEGVPANGAHDLSELATSVGVPPGPVFDRALACVLFGGHAVRTAWAGTSRTCTGTAAPICVF